MLESCPRPNPAPSVAAPIAVVAAHVVPPAAFSKVWVVWCGVEDTTYAHFFLERRQEPPHTAIRKLSPYSDRVISLNCYPLERLREQQYAAIRGTHVPGVQHAERAAEF